MDLVELTFVLCWRRHFQWETQRTTGNKNKNNENNNQETRRTRLLFLFSKQLKKTRKIRVCLVVVFKNYFLFLKTKNTKNMFGERWCVFVFCIFIFSKTNFLKTIKICFHYFFTIQRTNCSPYFLFLLFVFSQLLFAFPQR